jgi:hypothetical protein
MICFLFLWRKSALGADTFSAGVKKPAVIAQGGLWSAAF